MTMIQYFLLGTEACRAYEDHGIDKVVTDINPSDYAVLEYDERFHNGEDMISATVGWNDYACLTKEEYKHLKWVKEQEKLKQTT